MNIILLVRNIKTLSKSFTQYYNPNWDIYYQVRKKWAKNEEVKLDKLRGQLKEEQVSDMHNLIVFY